MFGRRRRRGTTVVGGEDSTWRKGRIRERGSVGRDQSQFAAMKLFWDLIARFRGNWYVAPVPVPKFHLVI